MSATRFAPVTTTRIVRLLLLGGALLLVVWLALKAFRIGRYALALNANQEQLETLLAGGNGLAGIDPDAAEQLIFDVRRNVGGLYQETRPFNGVLRAAGRLPTVGPLLADAPHLLEAADAGTNAATFLYYGLKPGLELIQADTAPDQLLPGLMQVLVNAQPALEQAERDLARAAAAYARVEDPAALPGRLQPLLEPVDRWLPIGQDAVRLLQLLPTLAGQDGERHYLLLAQNADELRATGGFISSAGILTVNQGQIVALDLADSYTVDRWAVQEYEFPPQPYYDFMGLELFLFRDANFWPEFAVSAEKAIALYRYGVEGAPPIDGVIALDQWFVQALVSAVGPIDVPELDVRVNGRNVIGQMQAAWGPGDDEAASGNWFRNRKSFMGSMMQALLTKVMADPASFDITLLLQAVVESAENKHLLFYMRDDDAAAVLREMAWDGHVDPPGHDFVLPLDTNMGFNKVNAVLERSVVYEVALNENGGGEAALDISYTHPGPSGDEPCVQQVTYSGNIQYADLIDDCYWNYLRVYAPAGSRLTNASRHPVSAEFFNRGQSWDGAPATFDEDGFTVFDNFMLIERGASLISSYRYQLPDGLVTDGDDGTRIYRLLLAKQAGAQPQAARLHIVLPPGATPVDVTPTPSRVTGQHVFFEETLDQDLTFTITFRP